MNPPPPSSGSSGGPFRRRTCYIEDLAQDTLLQIFLELGPFEIFTVRQCSKRLYAATHERTVWVKFLRRFCWEYHVCAGIFPIERMSVRQMEHTVTSPTRFHRRLLHTLSPDQPLHPISTNIVIARADLPSSPSVNDVKLMTGGRFLIGVAADYKELHLWDLGFTPTSAISPKPIVTKRMNGHIRDILAQPTADSLGVMFLVNTGTETIPPQSLLEVYEMYPDSAVLHRLASWKFSGEPLKRGQSTTYLSGPYVVVGYLGRDGGGEILVWNYVDNTATKWDIDYINENDEIGIHDSHVILVGEEVVTVWKIPPLHARIPGVDVHRENNLPSTSIDHCGYRPLHAGHRQPSSLTVFHVDVFADALDEDDGMCRLRRYVVTAPSGVEENLLVDPREPSIFPVFVGESPIPPEDQSDEDHYFSTWLGEREIVIIRSEHEKFLVRASAVAQPSLAGRPNEQSAHGMIWVGPASETVDGSQVTKAPGQCLACSFCPVSGRACVVDGSEIRIMDYLSS